jgi:hypothetical protein
LASKKRRKKWRIAKKSIRHNLRLTKVEAEVLFTILKNNSPMTYEEIAASYRERFGQKKAKKSGTIKVCVNNVKRLELATGRKYLQSSGSKPETYRIHPEFVEYQRTAIVLMEADRGYRQLEPDRPVEWEISRNDFEQYICETYDWDRSLVTRRVDDACNSHYLSTPELEANRQFIKVEDRLNHDVEYLRLVLEDYLKEQQRETPGSPMVAHLTRLRSLYGFENLAKVKGGDG